MSHTPPFEPPVLVAAFYKFVALGEIDAVQKQIEALCAKSDICGTILLANEGINATLSGGPQEIAQFLDALRTIAEFADIQPKYSFAREPAFDRLKIRRKKEIVTLGVDGVNPRNCVGRYVKPEDWNSLIAEDGVMVIDTRNAYEVAIGTFEAAIDPKTKNFREFPQWVDENLDRWQSSKKPKKIAMFCTGGIRCEKATSFLKSRGYDNIFHLEGGILKYLEKIPKNESKWIGECFVFDTRVSLRHGLVVGDYDMCHACRMPLRAEDKHHPHYVEGVACAKCYTAKTPAQRQRFCERQKQIKLAHARGQKHLGRKAVDKSSKRARGSKGNERSSASPIRKQR